MLSWLLMAIVLYYVQVFTPAIFKLLSVGLGPYFGSRADIPALTGVPARLERAAENMKENFPVFATLAVTGLSFGFGDNQQAVLGAQIFVVARVLYIPLYAFAVPLIRSFAAAAGWVGMYLMAMPLLTLI